MEAPVRYQTEAGTVPCGEGHAGKDGHGICGVEECCEVGDGDGGLRRNGAGGVFYKTQLCFKFMQGRCAFKTCKFAHGVEELRDRPPDCQRMQAGDDQELCRAKNGRRARGEDSCVTKETLNVKQGAYMKRRRVCYQWEATGTCSFGDTCRYPHDPQQHKEEGLESFNNDNPCDWRMSFKSRSDWKPQTPNGDAGSFTVHKVDTVKMANVTLNENPNIGIVTSIGKPMEMNNSSSNTIQVSTFQRRLSTWKGPQKISTIYGDWIDE